MATVTLPTRSIPGPQPLPLIGGSIRLFTLFRSPFTTLRQLHQRYGDLVALSQGRKPLILAFGPALNHALLARPDVFENGSSTLVPLPKGSAVERLFFNSLPGMNGAHHKQQRRLMQPAFHRQSVLGYHADMVGLTQRALDRWRVGSQIDLLQESKQLTQQIAVKTLFGLDDERQLAQVGGLLRRMLKVSSSPLALLAPVDLPGTPYHRMVRLAEGLEAFMRSLIAQKRATPGGSDMLAALIQARDEEHDQLSDDELISHAFTLFVAGHETTSNALTWTVFLLNQHPRVAADLLDELDRVLRGDAPTAEQFRSPETLPLLDAVIKESLRLLPPAVIGLRKAAAPCELGGYMIPQGAHVIYSEFITHRLPELYAEPERFKPERWAALDRSLYEYLPFGAGPHMCIGAGFATHELKVVLAMLLQRFRLAVLPGVTITPNLSMRPTRGMPMRVFAQDRQFARVPVGGMINRLVEIAA